MSSTRRLLTVLGFGLLLSGPTVFADSEVYLIYPESWCQAATPERLHFTTTELGVSEVFGFSDPSHGRVFLDPAPSQGGFYLPICGGLINTGFDFFQLSGSEGNLVNVTVLLGNGEPEAHEVKENGNGGVLGGPWRLVWEDGDPTSGVQLIEWPVGEVLEGTHGFRVAPGAQADSYLRFRFHEDLDDTIQPPGRRGNGNNGVETIIIIRPPSPPGLWNPGGGVREQIVYATGLFDSASTPGTLLRMRNDAGAHSIQAEAASTTGSVTTVWCPLVAQSANEVYVHHIQGLNGDDDSLTLRVGPEGSPSCEETVEGFVSVHPPTPEHRFGVMDPSADGFPFDFDQVQINSVRFEPGLEPELIDDFESGAWSPSWGVVNPGSIHVDPGAAHTGTFGLEVLPTRATSSYLEHALPPATSDLACRLSLDADFTGTFSPNPEVLFLDAQGNFTDPLRLWVRRSGSSYQLQAYSGSSATPWLPLNRLPATLDLRWVQGVLELWIQGCGPDGSNCGAGHLVGPAGTAEITSLRLGAISVPQPINGKLTVDNVLCLRAPTESP